MHGTKTHFILRTSFVLVALIIVSVIAYSLINATGPPVSIWGEGMLYLAIFASGLWLAIERFLFKPMSRKGTKRARKEMFGFRYPKWLNPKNRVTHRHLG